MINKDFERYALKKRRLVIAWLSGHTFFAVLNYRISNYLYKRGIKLLPEMIKFRTIRRYGCEISPYASIGEGLFLPHSLGIVIGHEVIIGKRCEIFQNVTIGSNRKECLGRYMPTIGDDVSIGTGAVVVGPIHIGNNVTIAANSFVGKDVPDNCIVAGVPAKIIAYK